MNRRVRAQEREAAIDLQETIVAFFACIVAAAAVACACAAAL